MLFIGEKRDVAFSESSWYLGGAHVQCTQSKIKRHMYHYLNTYIYILLKISTNSSKHLDIKGAIIRTYFCGFPFQTKHMFSCCSGQPTKVSKELEW